jgi:hypothetical protein
MAGFPHHSAAVDTHWLGISASSGLAQQPRPLLAPGPLQAENEVAEDFPYQFPGFSSVLSGSSVQWIRGVKVAWR